MSLELPAVDFAVRLADEGVPLRAIARATKIPSSELRDILTDARATGRLLELPHDDWPPGFPRDQRSLQLSRMAGENKAAFHLVVRKIFRLTATQVQLLLALLQHEHISKIDRSDMAIKTVEVHIHYMRKRLKVFGIKIHTLWGCGYQLSVPDRRKAMSIILRHVKVAPTL